MSAPQSSIARPLPIRKYMSRMWRFSPALIIAHGTLWGLVNLLLLVPGFLTSRFFTQLDEDADPQDLVVVVVLLAAVALAVSILILLAGAAEIRMRFTMSSLVRFNLLRALLKRRGAEPLPYPIGQTISRFRDDGYAAEDVMDWSNEIILNTMFGIVALIALYQIDRVITVSITIPLVLVLVLARVFSKRLTQYRESSSVATGDLAAAVGSILSAAPALQTAGTQRYALERIATLNAKRRRAMIRDATFTNAVRAMSSAMTGIGSGIVMLLAASSLRSGSLSIGNFTLFMLWIGYLVQLTRELGEYLAFMQQAKVAYRRLENMLDDAPPEALVEHVPIPLKVDRPVTVVEPERTLPRLDVLTINGLTSRYRSGSESGGGIEDISFDLPQGALVVVTGKIGSGKTTLLRALLGQVPVESGSIEWNGEIIEEPADSLVPPHAAYTPQIPRLFSDTLKRNILLGRPDDPDRLHRAMHDAVLDRDVAGFSDGLETMVGTRGLRLSGGQIQRTAAARMLLGDSDLLVIDDLSSALDVETERLLWSRLLNGRNRIILAVSHRRTALRHADKILVLRGGKLVASGTVSELLEQSADFRELWLIADEDTLQMTEQES